MTIPRTRIIHPENVVEIDRWMNGQIDRWANGCTWMDGLIGQQINRWNDDGWMDCFGQPEGLMDQGQTDRQIDGQAKNGR